LTEPTFYWHDYETWGSDPSRDRPCQFAGLRTDLGLNPIGEPLILFARPADDLLPQPEACLVTGITPQKALADGVPEWDFAAAIQQELAQPGTCGVGYNSIRFDDEITRHLFYRNLIDPYAHAWQHGNSRWDLIDTLRLAHALRPAGVQWPKREPGVPSFRLEDLTAANGIAHDGAHDALADVHATLALARLLKAAQPRLFDFALSLRDQRRVRAMVDRGEPLLHVSARYPAENGCIAPVAIVAPHPTNPKSVIAYDLRTDPSELLDLGADAIRDRVFTRSDKLPGGVERVPLKGIRLNAAPVLAPMATLTAESAERWRIDPPTVQRHARQLADARKALSEKIAEVWRGTGELAEPCDPELMLYSGPFFSDADRRRMNQLHALDPVSLAEGTRFDDQRLPTLLFRLRARNWPSTLTEAEREDWDAWRLERLTEPDSPAGQTASITIDDYQRRLFELRVESVSAPDRLRLIEALEAWADRVMDAGDP
jgi:exodeoxyribonuclease-1